MSATRKALRLTVYVDETDVHGEVPLYEAIVRRLQLQEVAGATVQTGVMGYGRNNRLHGRQLFGVSDDRPMIITAIDTEQRISAALPEIRAMVTEGLITVDEVLIPV